MHYWEGALGVKHPKKPTHRDEWLSGCVCGRKKTSWPQQTSSGLTHWSKPATRSLYFFATSAVCVCLKEEEVPPQLFCVGSVRMGDWSLCSHHIFERLICMWSRVRRRVVTAPLWAVSPRRSLSALTLNSRLSSGLFIPSLSRATFPFPCLSGREQGCNPNNGIFNEALDCFNVFVKCVWLNSDKAWIEMIFFCF